VLAARVVEYKPASVRPLAEVAAGIKQKLEKQAAIDMAVQQGQKLLEQLQHGEKAGVSWKAAQTISRKQHAGVEPELLKAAFRADAGKLPAYVGVIGQNGYALARIDAVKDVASVDEGKVLGLAQQIRQLTGEELLMAYLADARKRATITMKDFTAQKQ
jgi:peptidyl-prolyl cis-trans isomerase D